MSIITHEGTLSGTVFEISDLSEDGAVYLRVDGVWESAEFAFGDSIYTTEAVLDSFEIRFTLQEKAIIKGDAQVQTYDNQLIIKDVTEDDLLGYQLGVDLKQKLEDETKAKSIPVSLIDDKSNHIQTGYTGKDGVARLRISPQDIVDSGTYDYSEFTGVEGYIEISIPEQFGGGSVTINLTDDVWFNEDLGEIEYRFDFNLLEIEVYTPLDVYNMRKKEWAKYYIMNDIDFTSEYSN